MRTIFNQASAVIPEGVVDYTVLMKTAMDFTGKLVEVPFHTTFKRSPTTDEPVARIKSFSHNLLRFPHGHHIWSKYKGGFTHFILADSDAGAFPYAGKYHATTIARMKPKLMERHLRFVQDTTHPEMRSVGHQALDLAVTFTPRKVYPTGDNCT